MTPTLATIIIAEAVPAAAATMDYVWAALAGLALTALTVAGAVLKAYGDVWVAKIKNEKVRDKVGIAKDQIGTVVFMLSQTMVPKIRAAAADGRIDEVEREQLRKAALDEAQAQFSDEWWDNLLEDLGIPKDRRAEWILAEIEARVFRMKMEREKGTDPGVG